MPKTAQIKSISRYHAAVFLSGIGLGPRKRCHMVNEPVDVVSLTAVSFATVSVAFAVANGSLLLPSLLEESIRCFRGGRRRGVTLKVYAPFGLVLLRVSIKRCRDDIRVVDDDDDATAGVAATARCPWRNVCGDSLEKKTLDAIMTLPSDLLDGEQ
jgi:hypothetical protein